MKKNYVTPRFEVENFLPNDTVTSCSGSSTYNQVTVQCLISGSHTIFYSSCDSNYDDMTIVKCTDTGAEYLIWENTSSGGGGGNPGHRYYFAGFGFPGGNSGGYPGGGSSGGSSSGGSSSSITSGVYTTTGCAGNSGETLLSALVSAIGSSSWQNYHAGKITPNITKVINAS